MPGPTAFISNRSLGPDHPARRKEKGRQGAAPILLDDPEQVAVDQGLPRHPGRRNLRAAFRSRQQESANGARPLYAVESEVPPKRQHCPASPNEGGPC